MSKRDDEFKNFMNWVLNEEDFAWILDRCLEWLRDSDYLNRKGKLFARKFWEKYISDLGREKVLELK